MRKITFLFLTLWLTMAVHAQVVKTANVTSAGTLSTVASTYLSTVTNLTVTGTIDARDVKTMRDNMPVLAVLNLSAATIAAYTGTAGTGGSNYQAYLANELPYFSFCDYNTSIGKITLKTVILPNYLISMGGHSFDGCTGLTSITIPSYVTSIGQKLSGQCIFQGCTGLTSITIPNSVTSIGDMAFYGCTGLTNIAIPSSVTWIGVSPFTGCTGLQSITIPSSVTSIADNAFMGCSGLTSITIPGSVTSIGTSAFYGCTGLTSIVIPSSVTSIGNYAFGNCLGLTSIYANPITPISLALTTSVFYALPTACVLYVPVGSISAYKSATIWSSFTNISDGSPIVMSTTPNSISSTTAISGGTITSTGTSPVVANGVCWGTVANPTTANSKTVDGIGLGMFTSAITGLTSSTIYHIRAYATNSTGTAYGLDLTFTTLGTPTVTTTSVSNITSTTASASSNITSAGTSSVTTRGVCWSSVANPTTANSKTVDSNGSGVFTSAITGLSSSTTYHIRAYATNGAGTSYGDDLTFNTLGITPIVITNAASAIATNSAVVGGNVTSIGSSPVTARGICWSKVANPTTADSTTSIGSGVGVFTTSITGLALGTIYHVRAYATSSVGTSYGNDMAFTTLVSSSEVYLNNIAFMSKAQDITKTNIPTTMTMSASNQNNFVNPGNLVRFKMQCFNNKTNGTNIVSGLCKVRSTDPYITLTDSTSGLNNVGWHSGAWSTDEFELQINNNAPLGHVSYVDFIVTEGANSYSTYQVPILIAPLSLQTKTVDDDNNPDSHGNSNGICESNEIIESLPTLQNVSVLSADSVNGTFGNYSSNSGISIWNNKQGSSGTVVNSSYWNYSFAAPHAIVGGAKDMLPQWDFVFDYNRTSTYHTTLGLAMSGTFQLFSGYKSYIKWHVPIEYNVGYVDSVATSIASAITTTGAMLGGNISSAASAIVTARGICWSTSANPTTANNKISNGSGTGIFASTISGLTSGTTYHCRAYATTSLGTSYGSDVSFATSSISGILENNTDNLGIYPNPTNGKVTVNLATENANSYTVSISNTLGQKVYISKLSADKTCIDMNKFGSQGIYYIQITNDKGVIVGSRKVVLQ